MVQLALEGCMSCWFKILAHILRYWTSSSVQSSAIWDCDQKNPFMRQNSQFNHGLMSWDTDSTVEDPEYLGSIVTPYGCCPELNKSILCHSPRQSLPSKDGFTEHIPAISWKRPSDSPALGSSESRWCENALTEYKYIKVQMRSALSLFKVDFWELLRRKMMYI